MAARASALRKIDPVLCQKAIMKDSRCFPLVEVEDAAETFSTPDRAFVIHLDGYDQLVTQPLMISVAVIVVHKLS